MTSGKELSIFEYRPLSVIDRVKLQAINRLMRLSVTLKLDPTLIGFRNDHKVLDVDNALNIISGIGCFMQNKVFIQLKIYYFRCIIYR